MPIKNNKINGHHKTSCYSFRFHKNEVSVEAGRYRVWLKYRQEYATRVMVDEHGIKRQASLAEELRFLVDQESIRFHGYDLDDL